MPERPPSSQVPALYDGISVTARGQVWGKKGRDTGLHVADRERLDCRRMEKMMEREEFYFLSSDRQTQVHGYCWKPEGKAVAALQLSHGMMEHIGRYERFAAWMAERGVVVIGHDHLGHGKTGRREDLSFFAEKKGGVCLVQDLFSVTRIMEEKYPDIPHILLGHSMGSFIARRYLTVHGEHLDGLILMGTGGQPLWMACAGKLAAMLVGAVKGRRHQSFLMEEMVLGSYNRRFRPNRTTNDWLSADEKQVDKFLSDPYCNIPFSCQAYVDFFNILIDLGLHRQFCLIPRSLPVLFVSGNQDPVGGFGKGVARVYKEFLHMGMKRVFIKLYPRDRHEVLNERNWEEVYKDLWRWMEKEVISEG